MRAVSRRPVPLALHSTVLRNCFLRLEHGLDEGGSASESGNKPIHHQNYARNNAR